MKNSRKQLKFDKNSIEALRETGSSMVRATGSVLKAEAQEDISRAWKQLLGINEETRKQTANLAEHASNAKNQEEVIFSTVEKKVHVEAGIDYVSEILHAETRISNENHRQLNMQIEELRIEIAKLAKSSKQLEFVVKDVSIQTMGPNVGKYHLNFFEWVLATIQTARIRVEESANWLSQVSTKSQKRGYWTSVKQHGTSYMLSGERVVAQQTG